MQVIVQMMVKFIIINMLSMQIKHNYVGVSISETKATWKSPILHFTINNISK